MSYALDLAPEARPTLAAMPFEVQEHYVFILYVIDSAGRTIRVRSIGYITQTI